MAKRRMRTVARKAARHARGAAKGGGSTMVHGATGVAAFYLTRYAAQKVKALQDHWWAVPAVMLGAGHFAKRKPKFAKFGPALIGAAGAVGAISYEFQQANQAAQGTNGVGRLYVRGNRQLAQAAPAPMAALPPMPDIEQPEQAQASDAARLFVVGG